MCTKRNTKSKVAYKEINMQGTCFYSLIHSFAVSLARMPSPNSTIRKSTKSNLGISYTPAFILYTLSISTQWERQRGSRSLLLYYPYLLWNGLALVQHYVTSGLLRLLPFPLRLQMELFDFSRDSLSIFNHPCISLKYIKPYVSARIWGRMTLAKWNTSGVSPTQKTKKQKTKSTTYLMPTTVNLNQLK